MRFYKNLWSLDLSWQNGHRGHGGWEPLLKEKILKIFDFLNPWIWGLKSLFWSLFGGFLAHIHKKNLLKTYLIIFMSRFGKLFLKSSKSIIFNQNYSMFFSVWAIKNIFFKPITLRNSRERILLNHTRTNHFSKSNTILDNDF